MVYEYICGECKYYGGLGDCIRPMEKCIKDEDEDEDEDEDDGQ